MTFLTLLFLVCLFANKIESEEFSFRVKCVGCFESINTLITIFPFKHYHYFQAKQVFCKQMYLMQKDEKLIWVMELELTIGFRIENSSTHQKQANAWLGLRLQTSEETAHDNSISVVG